MKLQNVHIENVGPFEEFDAVLGAVVILTGRNAAGKTALLSSIRYQWDRGHDPDMAAGDKVGIVLTTLDDGTQIRTRLSKDKTERMVKPAGGKRFEKGREFFDSMANAISYDPLAFLAKSDKEQVEEVLRIMPVTVADEEMMAAVDDLTDEEQARVIGPLDLGGRTGLEILNVVTSAIYDARTGENVGADTLEKHAGELKASLDAMQVDDTDWGAKLSDLQQQNYQVTTDQANLESTLTIEVRRVMDDAQRAYDDVARRAKETFDAERGRLEVDAAEAIRRIQEQLRSDIADKFEAANRLTTDAQGVMNRIIADKKSDARQRLDSAVETFAPVKEKLAADIAVAQMKRDQQASGRSTQDLIKSALDEAAKRRDLQKRMTSTLDKIRDLKALVASRLPLPCTFSEGRICREENGVLVPLKKWNTASQYAFVLKLATLSHGAVGFVVVDKMEALDKENREAFLQAANHYAETENMQFITAFVGEGELKVENYKGE